MVTKPEQLIAILKGKGCISHRALCNTLNVDETTLKVHVQNARKIYGRRSIVNVYGTGYKIGELK